MKSLRTPPCPTQIYRRNLSKETVQKKKLSKKKIAIIGAFAIVVIVVVAILLIPTKFERVADECLQIAGQISRDGKSCFGIDTSPNITDPAIASFLAPMHLENALKAIQYANEELGFNDSVYSQMLNTSALMGRQSAETDKYRVSWTYHPDDGLEVTYEKK